MSFRKSRKRSILELSDGNEEIEYKFHVLLPNGISTRIILRDPGNEMLIDDFVHAVREEYDRVKKKTTGESRSIFWNGEICVEDMSENKFRKRLLFKCFKTNKWNMIRLHDGANEIIDTFQNMWDLTPDTELLSELPAEYTFETALADLIDNSLQAVWSNGVGDRRRISVTIDENGILIFDSGPGMDASDDNSIVKWGKMGSSNHRPSRGFAIGGKPPYLMPFFGMFGYGGPIASMHLGRSTIVSSKTKESKKVYILHLAREALLNKSSSKRIWRTDGGIRDPSREEIEKSPHGSFTQVEIQDLKLRCPETFQLQCRLKDIYFPYSQSDELLSTGKTSTPIEFQVNGVNLAEIEGGEIAITNLHSCNGPDFVLQLHFLNKQGTGTSRSPGSRGSREANARLKCVYFPIVEGKENIDRILEKLEAEGCGVMENFEKFCRVSIRRLGRLLPDARWQGLPFMEARHKKGDKAQLLKRCCWRVKCFVETDAGFSPTPSKTDLAHHDPFTIALRNFGHKPNGKESETTIEIYKDGTIVSLTQLEKEYYDWITQMHDGYDEEIDCGEDQPVLVVSPSNKKGLGISADVVRVHRIIRRKGKSWESGQKIIILKGAVGCPKNNLYATLEYILLEGFQGDVGGEARLICRPLDCEAENGCLLTVNGENATLDIGGSVSFPISVIDSGKCHAIDTATWNQQIEKRRQKAPATIDILNIHECHQLEIDGPLPTDTAVSAGLIPPKEIVAVVRPTSFTNFSSSKGLDQKYIVKGDLEMTMEITYQGGGSNHTKDGKFIYAERLRPSLRKGFHGLYIFSLESKLPKLFHKAGQYTFLFSVICTNSTCKKHEARVFVKPSTRVGKWELLRDGRIASDDGSPLIVRVGSTIPHISVVCYDEYSNQTPFPSIPGVNIKIKTKGFILICIDKMTVGLTSNNMILEIKDILVESGELDKIRPHYGAKLEMSSHDELFSVAIPCQVIPGPLSCVKMQRCPQRETDLLPGDVIHELVLELLDAYGNHVEKGVEIHLDVEGFCFQDRLGSQRKVDDQGYLNLSGLLRVTVGYGTSVSLSVFSGGKIFCKEEFHVIKRDLRSISEVPGSCNAGSQLKNVIFGIFDSEGAVDESIHGNNHTLTITSETLQTEDTILYTFQHGKCTVPFIPVPREPGVFRFIACHSHYPELQTTVEVTVTRAPKLELVSITGSDADVAPSQCLDGGIMLLQDSSVCDPTHIHSLAESIMAEEEKLQQDLARVGFCIGNTESQLKILHDRKAAIKQEIDDLRAKVGPQSAGHFNHVINAKDQIIKVIDSKEDAASVFCNLSKAVCPEENPYIKDVVGLVALLGTVNSDSLSRIFAEYLGENYMLALVCKSYEAANALEKYDKNGRVDRSRALHEAAAKMGKTIKKRFLVICLEEIRPYSGMVEKNDPQRKFVLPNPRLPSGKTPPGFLGYAVNMIDLDIHHLDTRISARYGLRETLFFLLFGELQVYDTREDMKQAFSCIKHGAISLDGAIMKENGIISLGYWETDIRFPVVTSGVELDLSLHDLSILNLIEDKNVELEAVSNEIAKVSELHAEAMKKFRKKSERLRKFIEDKGPFMTRYLLEYRPNLRSN